MAETKDNNAVLPVKSTLHPETNNTITSDEDEDKFTLIDFVFLAAFLSLFALIIRSFDSKREESIKS